MGPSIVALLLFLLVFCGFLVLLAFLAVAASKSVRDGAGNNQVVGCGAGCLLGAIVLFLGFLGLLGFVLFAVGASATAAVGLNPLERVEVRTENRVHRLQQGSFEAVYPMVIQLEVRGDLGNELLQELTAQCASEGLDFEILHVRREPARDVTSYEIRVYFDEDDVLDLESELRRELEFDFSWTEFPEVEVEFRGAEPR